MSFAAASQRRVPGEAGIWVIVFGDLMLFTLFFATFAVYRMQAPAVFARSHALMGEAFGLVNTVLLLTSSWLVALCLAAVRLGDRQRQARWLVWSALGCGCGFVLVKAFEYRDRVAAGLVPATNDFFMLYFTLTGIHLLHVLVGLGALTLVSRRCRRPVLRAADLMVIESCAIFWHLVDMLWVVLFALFYLLP